MLEPILETALAFRDVAVSSTFSDEFFLRNVNGFIATGGITAVLGPTASGKSLLLRTLSGRVHDLQVAGDMFIEGDKFHYNDISRSVGFVSQEDILVGNLTARETLFNSAAMKRNKSIFDINEDVEKLLGVLELSDVADVPIGTVFLRGLSASERKRVEIGVELVAAPLILFLDEPTAGLDALVAFEVLKSIRDIVKASEGKLSVMLSIHQPTSHLLDLVDHIMILGGGTMNFFGTVAQSVEHLSIIGFPPPDNYTPTDYFLQVSDRNFAGHSEVNFAGSFTSSAMFQKLASFLDLVEHTGPTISRPKSIKDLGSVNNVNLETEINTPLGSEVHDNDHLGSEEGIETDHARYVDKSQGATDFWRQYTTLVLRDLSVFARDPALYYLQFVLIAIFGFFVGAAFFDIRHTINKSVTNSFSGILWILFMVAYTQTFKVYHLSKASVRFYHEKANNTYGVVAAFFAELTATAVGLLFFIPGTAVAYFMMGFPVPAYPYIVFVFWMTALTAESMVNVVSRLCPNATVGTVVSQGLMIIVTVFGSGVFIPWNNTPIYWVWLQELSIFTQASRAALTHLHDYIVYECDTPLPNYVCEVFQRTYPCDATSTNLVFCLVRGRTVMRILQGTSETDSPAKPFGYLVLIFAVCRIGILILMYYPIERIISNVRRWLSYGIEEQMVEITIKNRCLEDQVAAMVTSYKRKTGQTGPGSPEFTRERLIAAGFNNFENYKVGELFAEDYNPQKGADYFNTEKPPHCLVWKDLTLTLKQKSTVILDKMSGSARAGRVLAIMGPPGSGKTTLLNSLGNRATYGIVSGEITFGQRDFTTSDFHFVPRFDEVNDNFTVMEQIEFVGLQKCTDVVAMRDRLEVVLIALGLHDKANTICSALNKGDLKLLSIGMGIISNPGVLYLDEPTTGLDSTAAYSVVKHLVDLAATLNIAVVMTIHQPAAMVFDMLQDLYLLEGGRLAFAGPLSCSEKYFQNLGHLCPEQTAIADFLMHLISQQPQEQHENSWETLYLESKFRENISRDQKNLYRGVEPANYASHPPSVFLRYYHALAFFFKYFCRDRNYHYRRIVCLIFIAFFSGTLFLQLKPETDYVVRHSGALFINIWTVMISVVAASRHIARDRRQAVEHVMNSVISPGMYCFGQLIASMPFNFIAALTFQSIFHWLSNINPNGEAFIYAVLLTAGHLHLMEAYMLCIVEVLKNAMLSATFAMVVLGYLFLFTGFFITVNDMPGWISWISYLTPTKYSYDGYLYMIFHSQSFHIIDTLPKKFMSGDVILEKYFSQVDVKPWGLFGALLAWIALIRIVHYWMFLVQMLPYVWNKRVSSLPAKPEPHNPSDYEERQVQVKSMLRNCK